MAAMKTRQVLRVVAWGLVAWFDGALLAVGIEQVARGHEGAVGAIALAVILAVFLLMAIATALAGSEGR